ncbi:hypothetical protein GQ457_17G013660 [Hibiscus cannabinus]
MKEEVKKGFSPLFGMRLGALYRNICRKLVEKFDVESLMMKFSGRHIPIIVKDLEVVLGVKNKGRDVEEATIKFDGKELAEKHKITTNATYEQLEQEIVSGAFERDELKACILMKMYVRLFDYWSGIPSRGYSSFDGHARIHVWGKKDVAKIVTSLKGKRPAK